MFSLQHVEQRLSSHEPSLLKELPNSRRAAVAAILREGRSLDILLIRRSEQPGDPWSGHMAFPGGRSEPDDADLLSTAIRETREEVGIDLGAQAKLLGQLDDLQAMARGHWIDLVITPFVFQLDEPVELTPNGEVDETIWAPLEPLASGQADTTRPYSFEGHSLDLPGFQVETHIVWGLTYRMLCAFFELLRSGDGKG